MADVISLFGNTVAWSNVLSVMALVFGAAAFWYSSRHAEEAKRQADAIRGDLPPNISLHPLPNRSGEARPLPDFMLRIDNHNRRPIRITRVRTERPKRLGLVPYRVDAFRETLLGPLDRSHDDVPLDLTVEGTPPGSASFQAVQIKLVLSSEAQAPKRRGRRGKDGEVAVRVDFEVLSETSEARSVVLTSKPAA